MILLDYATAVVPRRPDSNKSLLLRGNPGAKDSLLSDAGVYAANPVLD
jgi:hypothetical protein